MEAGRRSPDSAVKLEATWRAVLDHVAGDGSPVAGGRSMGGRIASQVASKGAEVAGLALFAYPLHPPGRPADRRVEHLASLRVPALFCSGTNDAFASPDELLEAAALVAGAHVHLLEGADHGFNVPRSSGRTREQVWAEAVDALLEFYETV
jgi:predicted alpha/beta-hydrolase family hydrolase